MSLQEAIMRALLKEEEGENDNVYYYEINFDFPDHSNEDGYSKFFKSNKNVDGDYTEEVWNLALKAGVIDDEEYEDVAYTDQLTKEEYLEYSGKTEGKKVEAIDKEKVLNMKYSDLPDMCYGLLPSDKSIIIIKKGENGYYKTDFDDIEDTEEFVNRENSKMGVTPEQRMVMELRSMSGNWKLKNEESKKVEDVEKLNNMYEQGTTELEKAFTTEVKYWLQALIDDNPNDAIGVQALNVIDDEAKIKEIVDELVNGSDDLWEEIHLKIEQLAGIDYRNSTRGKIESKQIKTESAEPEENKKLDLKDRVKYAYENCNYSKRKDMPTVSDIMDYLGLDTYNNKLYNQISDILYELGYDWKLESKQIKTEDEDEEAPVVVEYWETEDDRDNGMGEIYEYYSENDIDNAIAVAKRILDKNNFASVEVWNTKTERSYYWSDGKDEKYFKV